MMQVRQGRINFTTLAELPDGALSCRLRSLSITSQLLHYLILEQLIVLLVTTVVPE
jgi:hypothetical protein